MFCSSISFITTESLRVFAIGRKIVGPSRVVRGAHTQTACSGHAFHHGRSSERQSIKPTAGQPLPCGRLLANEMLLPDGNELAAERPPFLLGSSRSAFVLR